MQVLLRTFACRLPVAGVLAAGMALALLWPGIAHADATIGTGTPASCQSNAAVNAFRLAVEAGGTVDFNCGSAPVTIEVDTNLTDKVTVVNGAGLITLDGANARQHFYVLGGGHLTLNDLVLIDGQSGAGGAIYVEQLATAVINRTFLTSNRSEGSGGAIYNRGTLTVSLSTLGSNIAAANGAGIYNDGGKVDVRDTYLISSQATNGGAIYTRNGPLTVATSAIRSGVVSANGSGIYVEGGSAEIVNSTFSNNRANGDGGGGIYANGTTMLVNVTFYENRAASGGAIYRAGGLVTVKNSIMAGSRDPDDTFDSLNCEGPTFISDGRNIVSDNSCVPNPSIVDDLLATDPQLGIWNNYGGPTRGYMPLSGSPAIGHAVDCPAFDQRGVARFPGVFGAGCDVGALEFGYLLYATVLKK